MSDSPAKDWLSDDGFNAALGDLDRGLTADGSSAPPRASQPAANASESSPARVAGPRAPLGGADNFSPLQELTFRRRVEHDAHLPRRLLNVFPESALEPERPSTESADAAVTPWAPPPPPAPAPAAPLPRHDAVGPTSSAVGHQPHGESADARVPYRSASYERAELALLEGIRARGGPTLVTAPRGMGKTTLCRGLVQALDRRTITFLTPEPPRSFDDLLRHVLVAFGVMAPQDLAAASDARPVLIGTLNSFLQSLAPLQATALVIVDDAQDVPVSVLVELDALLASPGPAAGVLQLVLVGEPVMTSRLTHADLRDLNARLERRTELGPLLAGELSGYIMSYLSAAGSRRRLDDDAVGRLFERSSGVPRLVNQLCDGALEIGRQMGTPVIDATQVEAAAVDLSLAPAPVRPRLFSNLLIVTIFTLLILAGAVGALWVWRDTVDNAILKWENIPLPPRSPARDLPAPIAPISPPIGSADNPLRRPI